MGYRSGPDFQQILPLTKVCKRLLIVNVVVWFVGTVVLEQYFLSSPKITRFLGLIPFEMVKNFFVWQPVTYLFIHSTSPMHIIFNMLLLWWLGSELERFWGARFFTLFYFVSGVGAALIYSAAVWVYAILTGNVEVLVTPVIGASAAIFGLLVAYGLIFGERLVYFMFFFPMKAKYFVAILGAVEVVLVLNNGLIQGKVANLAHIGGLIAGYVFLKIWPYISGGSGRGSKGRTGKVKNSKLRLVVNNPDYESPEKPKYWN